MSVNPRKRRLNLGDNGEGGGDSSSANRFTGRPYSENYFKILDMRKNLPVWKQREEFLKVVNSHQVVVLVGETGSGKTTQIPQFLLDAEVCVCFQRGVWW
jgi:pre-mRNA-splicing factor ATP-dependent RNA helicase DHX15/PRP43